MYSDNFIFINDHFSDQDLEPFDLVAKNIDSIGKKIIPPVGPFAGQLIAQSCDLKQNDDCLDVFWRLICPLLKVDRDCLSVSCLNLFKLYLPWDIHSDLHLEQVSPGFLPWYNFLLPLHDVDSGTIVFDQRSSEYGEFWQYKEKNSKLARPIDPEFWKNNLSMCWEEDRQYLSIQKVFPNQKRGQLCGFNRQYFHSSDCFHSKGIQSKTFVQIRVDIKRSLTD